MAGTKQALCLSHYIQVILTSLSPHGFSILRLHSHTGICSLSVLFRVTGGIGKFTCKKIKIMSFYSVSPTNHKVTDTDNVQQL